MRLVRAGTVDEAHGCPACRASPQSALPPLPRYSYSTHHFAPPTSIRIQLLPLNVAGYVYVTEVDIVRNTLTYLAPCPGQLPGKFLLAGSFKTILQ